MRGTLVLAVAGLLAGAPALALDPPPTQTLSKPVTVTNRSAVVSPPPQAVFVPKPVAAPYGSTNPKPDGNPGDWVLPEDYPPAALRDEIEGTVGFTLEVDAEGAPVSCTVTRSSGDDNLDGTACDRLMERAWFEPGRDSDGNAVAGTWSSRVRWVVPEDVASPAPPEGWLIAWAVVEKDGSVSSCKVERAEGEGRVVDFCDENPAFQPILDADGEPVRRRVRVMMRVVHEPLP